MSLPGPMLNAPAMLSYTQEGRLRRRARLLDGDGETIAQFTSTTWLAHRRTEVAGTRLLLRHRGMVFRLRLDIIDADGRVLVHITKGQLRAEGQTFDWQEDRGGTQPSVLGVAGDQVAVVTPQAQDTGVTHVQVTGARPVALLVLMACCEWERLRAFQRGLG
jgi:hypothetical protein